MDLRGTIISPTTAYLPHTYRILTACLPHTYRILTACPPHTYRILTHVLCRILTAYLPRTYRILTAYLPHMAGFRPDCSDRSLPLQGLQCPALEACRRYCIFTFLTMSAAKHTTGSKHNAIPTRSGPLAIPTTSTYYLHILPDSMQ